MVRFFLAFATVGVLASAPLDQADRQLSTEILKQLIETDTALPNGTTGAVQAMQSRFVGAGFAADDVILVGPKPDKQNLLVRLHGTGAKKPVLILCHIDVVPAKREDWTTDPFQLVEKDGYFYGRGTQDMKGNDAILVADFLRLKREGYKPDRDLILALTAGEESGVDNGADWLMKNRPELKDVAFVVNPDAGGVYTRSGKAVDVEIEATEKLYADYAFSSTSPGGHSSLPTADNTIYNVGDSLERLQHSPFPFELNNVTRAYFEQLAKTETGQTAADIRSILKQPPDAAAVDRLSKDPRYNSTMRTTCVATRFNAGVANNALSQRAEAVVNCRILPGHSAEEVRQDLIRIADNPQVSVNYIDPQEDKPVGAAPDRKAFMPPPLNQEVMSALTQSANRFWPGAPIIPEMETGASDSVYTMAAGVPSYGVSGLAIDENDLRMHGKDERIRIEDFYTGVDFYYTFLKALSH